MFEWKVENMVLLNEKDSLSINGKKIFNCESKVSREDKIDFVDSLQDGKLSYILSLIEKFEEDKKSMPKDNWGDVKTVSLIAWIKRNDKKYKRPIIGYEYAYGKYYLLGMGRYITNDYKGAFDTYEDLVDEVFHRQLLECEQQEYKYFLAHDEYSILKEKFRNRKYGTTFGVSIASCSNGEIYVYEDKNDDSFYDSKHREITIDELKYLLVRYEELDRLVEKITNETNIKY